MTAQQGEDSQCWQGGLSHWKVPAVVSHDLPRMLLWCSSHSLPEGSLAPLGMGWMSSLLIEGAAGNREQCWGMPRPLELTLFLSQS